MIKKITFKGRGEIEFNLPSRRKSITLKNGQSMEIEDESDIKVVKALRPLGIFIEDKKVSKKKPVEDSTQNVVEDLVQKSVEEPGEETISTEKARFTFSELHAKKADELRSLASELGIELQESASKKDMANAILEKLGE